MTLQSSTIRPGLLVALKTSIKGNVRYFKTVLDDTTEDEAGESTARWETLRRIADAKEQKLASQTRSRARTLVCGVCSQSDFGLLCPQDREAKLEAAIAEARKLAEDFNATSRYTTVSVFAFTGRVAADDVEAVKAINSEVRDLLSLIETGIGKLDVKAVRAAADRARDISQMLSPDAQARISGAIETARAAARQIVKAGVAAAQEIDQQAIDRIARARTAFLDLDGGGEIATPEAEARAVDLEPEHIAPKSYEAAPAQIEL